MGINLRIRGTKLRVMGTNLCARGIKLCVHGMNSSVSGINFLVSGINSGVSGINFGVSRMNYGVRGKKLLRSGDGAASHDLGTRVNKEAPSHKRTGPAFYAWSGVNRVSRVGKCCTLDTLHGAVSSVEARWHGERIQEGIYKGVYRTKWRGELRRGLKHN
jgi:hypothetical protein